MLPRHGLIHLFHKLHAEVGRTLTLHVPLLFQIEKKITEQLKEEIENKIQEVNEHAAANVTIINAQADALSLQLVEDARNQGLEDLYSALNFKEEQHKASFNYLRTLRKQKNIRLHVNFGNLISGPNIS